MSEDKYTYNVIKATSSEQLQIHTDRFLRECPAGTIIDSQALVVHDGFIVATLVLRIPGF